MPIKLDEQAQIYSLLREVDFEMLASRSDNELKFNRSEQNEILEIKILCDSLEIDAKLYPRGNAQRYVRKKLFPKTLQDIQEFIQSGIQEIVSELKKELNQ